MTTPIPKLRIMRDQNPMSGAVYVVDEKGREVARFRIKRALCHMAIGSIDDNMDAGRNLEEANALIKRLAEYWSGAKP